MKATEVRDKYRCVGKAINALKNEAFNEFMDKEEYSNQQEYTRYMAIEKVNHAMQNELLHIMLTILENPEAEAERTYVQELKATMNTVSKWAAEADNQTAKHAFGECLQVLVGAYIIEM